MTQIFIWIKIYITYLIHIHIRGIEEPRTYRTRTFALCRANKSRGTLPNRIGSNMFLRKNSMITRNGDSRQAERTREYVSIGENRMSVRANFNKKHYDIKKHSAFAECFFM